MVIICALSGGHEKPFLRLSAIMISDRQLALLLYRFVCLCVVVVIAFAISNSSSNKYKIDVAIYSYEIQKSKRENKKRRSKIVKQLPKKQTNTHCILTFRAQG
jgi:hypothetical protein